LAIKHLVAAVAMLSPVLLSAGCAGRLAAPLLPPAAGSRSASSIERGRPVSAKNSPAADAFDFTQQPRKFRYFRTSLRVVDLLRMERNGSIQQPDAK
jgi:hypothetical protein